MKKCKKCGAPLEGILYNTIGKLMGIKPSATDPEVCNKCAETPASSESSVESAAEAPVAETPVAETPVVEETPAVEETPVETPAEEKPEEEKTV